MIFARSKSIVFALLGLHAVLLGYIALRTSPVMQEPAHLVAGVAGWRLRRFHIFNVNPPLVRLVATLPVTFGPIHFDAETCDRPLAGREERKLGGNFLATNLPNARYLITISRFACIPFALTGAYFCWRFARDLYGESAGLLALALWSFCPYTLGHGATIMPDVPSAALGAAATYCFWQWLRQPTWINVVVAGLALGMAELCKFTLLIFYPMMAALWLVYRLPDHKTLISQNWLAQATMLIAIFLLSVYAINAGYMFEGTLAPLKSYRFESAMFAGSGSFKDVPLEGGNRFAGTWFGQLPVPLPANMVQGIDAQRYDFERGLASYLRGEWSPHGWWYYYLYAVAIKVPLGMWCLTAIAVVMSVCCRGLFAPWPDEMLVLGPMIVLFTFVSSQTGFSVHSRYIMPALPFLFIWTSKVARVFDSRDQGKHNTAIAATVTAALIWSVFSSVVVYPHSLSYFNELAAVLSTPVDASYPKVAAQSTDINNSLSHARRLIAAGPLHGGRHLLDSNIDWGQDLFNLEEWYWSHPEARPFQVAYSGEFPLEWSSIKSDGNPPFGPDSEGRRFLEGPLPGWYALSVGQIYAASAKYRYFLNFQPVATAGFSINIYHITLQEANRVRREYGLEELPNDWSI